MRNAGDYLPPLELWGLFVGYAAAMGAISTVDYDHMFIDHGCPWFIAQIFKPNNAYPHGFKTATSASTYWFGADDRPQKRGVSFAAEAWAIDPRSL
jgi:hypothetical protein